MDAFGRAVANQHKGEIVFDQVKFRYPTRLEMPVLEKLSVKVAKGEKKERLKLLAKDDHR